MMFRGLNDEDTMLHLPIGDPPEPDFEDDEPSNPDYEPPDEDDEEDLADLDTLLAEATAATLEEKRLKQARKRLVHIAKLGHPSKAGEQEALLAEIHDLEERRVWLTVGCVALFHTQECATCGARHAFFKGWMTEQKHASDPNARRLVAGKPAEFLPERREDHAEGTVECCSNCVECVIAINAATEGKGEYTYSPSAKKIKTIEAIEKAIELQEAMQEGAK